MKTPNRLHWPSPLSSVKQVMQQLVDVGGERKIMKSENYIDRVTLLLLFKTKTPKCLLDHREKNK